MADIDDRLLPSNLENSSVPEEGVLRTLFEVPLDQSTIKTHINALIPVREEVDGEVKKD